MSKKSKERKKKYSRPTVEMRKKFGKLRNNGKGRKGKERIEKVARELSDTEGLKPMGEIMRENGYSEGYSKNPQRVLESKTFQEVADTYFPMDRLGRKLEEKLEAKSSLKIKKRNKQGRMEETVIEVPNEIVQFKALELGFKVRGLIHKAPLEGTTNNFNILSLKALTKASDIIKENKVPEEEKIQEAEVVKVEKKNINKNFTSASEIVNNK